MKRDTGVKGWFNIKQINCRNTKVKTTTARTITCRREDSNDEVQYPYINKWRENFLTTCMWQELWLTRRASLVEQELLIFPEHLSSPRVFSWVRVTRSLVLYVCFVYRCLSFCTLSVLLWYTDCDCLPLVSSSLSTAVLLSFCITARHTHTVAQIDIFVYIKSCQYSMFYTNCSWNFSCIH